MNVIIRLLISAVAAYALTYLLPGVHIADFTSAIIFCLVLGILNAILKPILVLLTIPITIITLGLFLLVINALIILLAARMMDSIKVDGFLWALIFSVLLSVVSGILNSVVTGDKD